MIKPGSDVLFQEPDCNVRRLRRSVAVAVEDDLVRVQFVAEPFAFEVDQDVLLYFNGKREFLQQVGRVAAVETSEEEGEESRPIFAIEPVGDAVSAESREHYRVSTISAGLEAELGSESALPVQDLSATGLAIVAAEAYTLGDQVEVSIQYGEDCCHGKAAVQSVRELGPGRTRYGLRALEEDAHTPEFLEVLRKMSLAVQREQLQRSGA